MILVDTFRNENYMDVHDSARGPKGDQYPCVVCGRGVSKGWRVHLHEGGSALVTEAEAAELNATGHENADMYGYPLGRDCLRAHPELKPYVVGEWEA
jgi:hypothetical protein